MNYPSTDGRWPAGYGDGGFGVQPPPARMPGWAVALLVASGVAVLSVVAAAAFAFGAASVGPEQEQPEALQSSVPQDAPAGQGGSPAPSVSPPPASSAPPASPARPEAVFLPLGDRVRLSSPPEVSFQLAGWSPAEHTPQGGGRIYSEDGGVCAITHTTRSTTADGDDRAVTRAVLDAVLAETKFVRQAGEPVVQEQEFTGGRMEMLVARVEFTHPGLVESLWVRGFGGSGHAVIFRVRCEVPNELAGGVVRARSGLTIALEPER